MFEIRLRVRGARIIKGTTRTAPFAFSLEFPSQCSSKAALFRASQREFGRCTGRLYDGAGHQLGWCFEGKEPGTSDWWMTEVLVVSGAVNVGTMVLVKGV